jgi:hypothetical protein
MICFCKLKTVPHDCIESLQARVKELEQQLIEYKGLYKDALCLQDFGNLQLENAKLRKVVDVINNATWEEGVGGHAIIGPFSWERIQEAIACVTTVGVE